MPGKKPPPKKPRAASAPPWQIILEEMRSQNHATIEAVQTFRSELKQDIAELREEAIGRLEVLESVVRQNGADIRQNSADIRQNSADIRQLDDTVRGLSEKVDDLSSIEARVSALERQRG